MNIEVRNLGVIKQAEIDLKPLTIFIGPNNAGKTWLAYTLAGILGPYGQEKYMTAYIADKVQNAYPDLDAAIQQIVDEGNTKIDLVEFADRYGEEYINNVANLARDWMQQFMGSEWISFENLEVRMWLAETKKSFLEQVLNHSLERNVSIGQRTQTPLLTLLKESGKRELYIYTSTEGSILEKLPPRAIKEFLVGSVFGTLHSAMYPYIYTFPAERTAFITLPYFELVNEKPDMEPVRHFLNMVVNLFRSSLSKREREARKDIAIQTYIQLAQLLEKQVLHGSVDFSTSEPDPFRKILFEANEGVTLEIFIASSMVKELSSLVLYLRYIAEPGDWLIIDEPEINLHPEAQARLTEFLAMLIQAGLHVLVTTHSPYMIDHLANLMKAAEHKDQESQEAIRDEFYLQRTEAFISKENVSVYLVDNGTTKSILGEDGLIYWDTFSDVSDKVTQIYFKL